MLTMCSETLNCPPVTNLKEVWEEEHQHLHCLKAKAVCSWIAMKSPNVQELTLENRHLIHAYKTSKSYRSQSLSVLIEYRSQTTQPLMNSTKIIFLLDQVYLSKKIKELEQKVQIRSLKVDHQHLYRRLMKLIVKMKHPKFPKLHSKGKVCKTRTNKKSRVFKHDSQDKRLLT